MIAAQHYRFLLQHSEEDGEVISYLNHPQLAIDRTGA